MNRTPEPDDRDRAPRKAAAFGALCALALAGALAGCRGPTSVVEYLALDAPNRWTAHYPTPASPHLQNEPWWRDFGGDEVDALLTALRDGSPSLEAAIGRRDAALAQARISGASLGPQSALELQRSRQRQRFVGLPLPGGDDSLESQFDTSQLTLRVDWELDLWGRLRAARTAARYQAQAEQHELEGLWQSLIAQTLKTWISTIEAARLTEIAIEARDNLQVSTTLLERRYDDGLVSLDSVEMSRQAYADAIAQTSVSQAEFDAMRRSLNALIGTYPDTNPSIPSTLPELLEPISPGIPSETLECRPDVQAARERLAAGSERVWQARATLLPRVALTGSTGTLSSDLSELLRQDFSIWNLAGGITQPVFQSGRLRASVDLETARERSLAAEYVRTMLHAMREVETGLTMEVALHDRLQRSTNGLSERESIAQRRHRRHARGLESRLRYLEAERDHLLAQSQVVRSRADLLRNRVDLRIALGAHSLPATSMSSNTATAHRVHD